MSNPKNPFWSGSTQHDINIQCFKRIKQKPQDLMELSIAAQSELFPPHVNTQKLSGLEASSCLIIT